MIYFTEAVCSRNRVCYSTGITVYNTNDISQTLLPSNMVQESQVFCAKKVRPVTVVLDSIVSSCPLQSPTTTSSSFRVGGWSIWLQWGTRRNGHSLCRWFILPWPCYNMQKSHMCVNQMVIIEKILWHSTVHVSSHWEMGSTGCTISKVPHCKPLLGNASSRPYRGQYTMDRQSLQISAPWNAGDQPLDHFKTGDQQLDR